MEKITSVSRYIKEDLRIGVANRGSSAVYVSKIMRVTDKSFFMYEPKDNTKKMLVKPGMELEFVYIIDSGKYTFVSTVHDVVSDNIDMIEVNLPSYLERLELRKFFRVEMLRSIPVYKVTSKALTGNRFIYERGDFVPMTCTDLSGGGMKLSSNVKIATDDILEVDLSRIDSSLPDKVMVKVVRSVDNNDGTYTLGIMFTSLTESDRDKIIKFVFQRQTEQRKVSK